MVKYWSRDGSGGDTYITGWINILYPYLENRPNDLCLPWVELKANIEKQGGPKSARGRSIGDFGKSFCSAPVIWEYYGDEIPLVYKAGFVGSIQDPITGDITPQISWAVLERTQVKKGKAKK